MNALTAWSSRYFQKVFSNAKRLFSSIISFTKILSNILLNYYCRYYRLLFPFRFKEEQFKYQNCDFSKTQQKMEWCGSVRKPQNLTFLRKCFSVVFTNMASTFYIKFIMTSIFYADFGFYPVIKLTCIKRHVNLSRIFKCFEKARENHIMHLYSSHQ